MKDLKLYKLEIGRATRREGDVLNWMGRNVLAKTAAEAIRKAKLSKSEYVVQATLIATVNAD